MIFRSQWVRAVAIMAISGFLILQYLSILHCDGKIAELAEQNRRLQSELAARKTVSEPRGFRSHVLTPSPESPHSLQIEVPVDVLNGFPLSLFGLQGDLLPETYTKLGITEAQATQMQVILNDEIGRLQELTRGAVRPVAQEELDAQQDSGVLNFLRRNPGGQSIYRVSPLNLPEREEALAKLSEALATVISPAQVALVLNRIKYSPKFWLLAGAGLTVAFADSMTRPGTRSGAAPAPISAIFIAYSPNDQHLSSSSSYRSRDVVPPELQYLFQALDASAAPAKAP